MRVGLRACSSCCVDSQVLVCQDQVAVSPDRHGPVQSSYECCRGPGVGFSRRAGHGGGTHERIGLLAEVPVEEMWLRLLRVSRGGHGFVAQEEAVQGRSACDRALKLDDPAVLVALSPPSSDVPASVDQEVAALNPAHKASYMDDPQGWDCINGTGQDLQAMVGAWAPACFRSSCPKVTA